MNKIVNGYMEKAFVAKLYNKEKIIKGLRSDGMSTSEAVEFFDKEIKPIEKSVFASSKLLTLVIENAD